MADVSLYIPCFNGAATLTRCLDSVLACTNPPADIMVIDDGSTDESAAIVARHASVRLISHPYNKGLGAARNSGLRQAKFNWVASIDADVKISPEWMNGLLALRESFPTAIGFGGRLIETEKSSSANRWRSQHMRQEWGDVRRVNPPFLFGANTLLDRRILLSIGGYDERLRTNGEDVNLAYRLRENNRDTVLVYEPTILCYHMRSDTLRSVLRNHWAWNRNPYAVLFPARTLWACLVFSYRRLVVNAASKMIDDLCAGRWRLSGVGLLCLLDNPVRELNAYFNTRR